MRTVTCLCGRKNYMQHEDDNVCFACGRTLPVPETIVAQPDGQVTRTGRCALDHEEFPVTYQRLRMTNGSYRFVVVGRYYQGRHADCLRLVVRDKECTR